VAEATGRRAGRKISCRASTSGQVQHPAASDLGGLRRHGGAGPHDRAEALALKPDASSSPTARATPQVPYAAETTRNLMGKCDLRHLPRQPDHRPRARRHDRKLKFGHHGANQPVKDLHTNKVEITSQNHNFVVDLESLKHSSTPARSRSPPEPERPDRRGIRHKELRSSASSTTRRRARPHDAGYLFKRFVEMMERNG